MSEVNKESSNLIDKNQQWIKEKFPSCFSEEKLDFDKLKELLSEIIVTNDEKYSFSWAGRSESLQNFKTTSRGTLIPDKEESVNFDETENIFIEGENLEVLKLLQKSYDGKIKMIYIDPPYNTGNDFIYKDDFKNSITSYLEQTSQTKNGIKQTTNTENSGRFHSNWLSFMYPRLIVSKNLLRDDGVIFVSIDDNELHNLIHIMNEIFGEENFVANIIWRRKRGRDNSAKYLSKSHEYLLLYAKNKNEIKFNRLELDENTKTQYKNPENDPRGKYRTLGLWSRGIQGGSEYEFVTKNGKKFSKRKWLVANDTMKDLEENNKLIIVGDKIYRKLFLSENEGKIPETLWDDTSNSANAADEIKEIFGKQIFDTPKPTPFIERMLDIATEKNDIVLDFFAGSCSTADALLKNNYSKNSNKKFICIQLPEIIPGDAPAKELGYDKISDIGKARIKFVLKSLSNLSRENDSEKTDLGFKVFKLVKSNYKIWEEVKDDEKLKSQLKLFEDSLVENYKDIDVIYEIILKEGYSLNSKIETLKEKPNKIYKVSDGEFFFYITLDKTLDENTISSLNLTENLMFVCLDSALNDSQKINLDKICKLKVI